MKNILKYAFLNAFSATAYIGLVAFFMKNVGKILGPMPEIIGMMSFLLLFVISAAMMGLLIFGRPILWYLDGKKAEAIKLISYTIVVLIIIVLFFMTFLSITSQI